MNQEEIKRRANEIERLYKEYMTEMEKLKKEQDKVLGDFLHELERVKMEEIRNKLSRQDE